MNQSDEDKRKIAMVKKLMDDAILAIEAQILEAEWNYWSAMVELHTNFKDKL